jgi:geranylgeranyl diphosphate synthase type II
MNYPECKELVNEIITEYLQDTVCDTRIGAGMEYILDGGKRLRPVLTLAVLEKLLPDSWTEFQQVCLVPELIHSSSLIIDDLPAFDNALVRRGKQCVHLAKGEGLAYLLSFNLVTEAVMIVHKQLPHLKKACPAEEAYQQYEAQIYNIITNISSKRAIGGQLLSTFHTNGNINLRDMTDIKPPHLSREEICDILLKKTSSFFEIALVIGWIVGQGDLERVKDIQELANILGLCYQIYDDFLDYHEDVSDSGHFSHNYVYHRGIEIAYQDFLEYNTQLTILIENLGLSCPMFDFVKDFMETKVSDAKSVLKEVADT